MKSAKVITLLAMSILMVALTATAGQAENIKWRDIIGIVEAGNVVGLGNQGFPAPGVPGGAPWSTLGGRAKVNLETGHLQFQVKGLVLAAGTFTPLAFHGLPIGTTGGIQQVEGTLVCDVSGGPGGANPSVLVDTDPVPLSATGDAQFNGKVTLPNACNDPDIAFLIRIVDPPFTGVWIANGAVLDR